MKRFMWLAVAGAIGAPAVVGALGGWAVITVEDVPEFAVAGEPFALPFTVRQHGMTLLSGLRASVQARLGTTELTVAALPAEEAGRYAATLTLPREGDWVLTVRSGFGNSNRTLAPLPTLAPGALHAAVTDVERGKQLFVAKGCVTCHVNAKVNSTSEIAVGPDLTERRYGADFLSRFLVNPSLVQPPKPGAPTMPVLGLKSKEIASLIAFINSEK